MTLSQNPEWQMKCRLMPYRQVAAIYNKTIKSPYYILKDGLFVKVKNVEKIEQYHQYTIEEYCAANNLL